MSLLPQTENGAANNDTSDRSAAGRSGDKVNGGGVSEQLQSTVFNCGLNPALKKKKIPRVIPPPPTTATDQRGPENGKMSRPFWKEPLPSRLQLRGEDDDDDAHMQITVQEMLKEKRRNESSYLQVGALEQLLSNIAIHNYDL